MNAVTLCLPYKLMGVMFIGALFFTGVFEISLLYFRLICELTVVNLYIVAL